MRVQLSNRGKLYSADLSKPLHIAISLMDGVENQPNAFGAPPFETYPLKAGDFIGSIDAGSPVNFFNVRVNPHGNGTHTETIGHITSDKLSIHDCLKVTHCVAELVTVYPSKGANGDRIIERNTLEQLVEGETNALIVRTMPNPESKRTMHYTGTNPPYFTEDALAWIHERDYKHLLTDLPSVDKEEDGGALLSHKMFWQVPHDPHRERTITEMIYVANDIKDGIYLLDIQIAPFVLDVSPSRPVLFALKPES